MTTTPFHGDPPPPALAAYWQAIDDGRPRDAAACFSRDALYAVPPVGAPETASRVVTSGSAGIADRLVERESTRGKHSIVVCVAEGETALVEGVVCDASNSPISTYVCSVRTADDGLIDRYLAFGCAGARDAPPTDLDPAVEPADALAVVHDYFADLDNGRFEAAAARFSADVLYSHPPYQHTGIDDPGRIEFRGRPALQAAFDRRGRATFDHVILTSVQRGPHCILEGAVRGLPDGGSGSFISTLTLGSDGTIRRYVSFYCEPAIPAHC
ncbi:MAG: nuclear transport factor 2 family protein [Ilumatobacteraceae bacterium]